jgi:DNA-directed RNA polymerase subunit RPC12/RpoP
VTTRYRCTACGNLTRFDVTTTRRTRAFHHFTVGGDLAVEEEQVLDQRVESVTCRWCGSGSSVVELTDPSGPESAPPG